MITVPIETYLLPLSLSDETLKKVSSQFFEEMKKGLSEETNEDADMKMLPTYVTNTSTKDKIGKFLALDLGGTNFRVLLVNLAKGNCTIKNEIYSVPNHIMTGSGTELFDHIANCIYEFVVKYDVIRERLPLGFTFSFPLRQEGLAYAELIKWTKGFTCSGVVGADVVGLLQDAVERNGKFNVDVVAILNDTVGTLMSCAYLNESCAIGMIAGTGTNACYIEKIENVELLNVGKLNSQYDKEVLISTEWGSFGNCGVIDSIRTEYDRQLDVFSANPSNQIFEKAIGGMYLGELVRYILLDLIKKRYIFNGQTPEVFLSKDSFPTKYISSCETDKNNDYRRTKEVLQGLDVPNPTNEECKIVQLVCKLISTRAAHFIACGLSAILRKMGKPKVVIACDGSVLKYHPHLMKTLENKLHDLVPEIEFELMLSEDGSGRGAALVAAAAT